MKAPQQTQERPRAPQPWLPAWPMPSPAPEPEPSMPAPKTPATQPPCWKPAQRRGRSGSCTVQSSPSAIPSEFASLHRSESHRIGESDPNSRNTATAALCPMPFNQSSKHAAGQRITPASCGKCQRATLLRHTRENPSCSPHPGGHPFGFPINRQISSRQTTAGPCPIRTVQAKPHH